MQVVTYLGTEKFALSYEHYLARNKMRGYAEDRFSDERYLRRGIIGLVAGMLGGFLLGITLHNNGLGIVLGMLLGVLYALAFRLMPGAYAENIMTAAFFGVALWTAITIILLPLIMGLPPQWTTEGMRLSYPALVGWVLYGACTGLFTQALNDLASRSGFLCSG